MNLPTQIPFIRQEKNEFKKEFPGISEGCRDWIDWIIHIEILQFNLHFMEVVKRKLVPIKSMVSVKNSTLSLSFMVIIGMHTPIFFLMRMLNTLLESMMTKIIPLLPLKKFETMIVNVYNTCKKRATMLKSSGRVIGIHLLKVILKSKPSFHNFAPSLT